MQIKIRTEKRKLLFASEELLSLSGIIRQSGDYVEDVLRNLRSLSELEQCRYELKQQLESIEKTTGRVVMLSAALREVANLYSTAESRNEGELEEMAVSVARRIDGSVYSGTGIHDRVQKILKR